MNLNEWLMLAALLICFGLGLYAASLWRRVWQNTRQRESVESQRNQRLSGDIQFLAQSCLDGQLSWIEGSIRIKVLLDNYSGPRRNGLDLDIFQYIYSETAHIPTHQSWRALPAAERQLHRRRMEVLERDNLRAMEQAARQLTQGLA